MSYTKNHITAAPKNAGISELNIDEIEEVGGGIIPLALALGATYIQFSFIAGLRQGARDRAFRLSSH